MSFKISAKGIVMVAVPLLLNLVILAVFSYLLRQEQLDTAREARAREFQRLGNRVYRNAIDPMLLVLRYGTNPTDKSLARKYENCRQDMESALKQLRSFKIDDSSEPMNLDRLYRLHVRIFKILDAVKAAIDQNRDGLLLLHHLEIQNEMEIMSNEYLSEFDEKLDQSTAKQKAFHNSQERLKQILKYVIFLGFGANVVVSICLALFFSNTISTRLRVLRSNIQRLEQQQEGLNLDELRGGDEIAELGKSYSRMATMLQATRLRERTFIDNARDIICTINEELIITQISPSAESVWGYRPDDLVGRRINSLTDEKESPLTALSNNREVKGSEVSLEFENSITHKIGKPMDMLWSINWSPREKAFFCVVHDITGRKATEEHLKLSEARVRNMIDRLPLCLLTVDESGGIETANEKAQKILNLPVEQIVGKNLSDFIPKFDCTSPGIIGALNENQIYRSGAVSCTSGGNITLPVEVILTDLNFRGRRSLLAILADMSEQHRIERARLELVNMVSHDLRTPLSAIQVMMELLLTGNFGRVYGKDAQAISYCISELERLLLMVNSLLDLEKIKAGVLRLDREVNDLSTIVQKSIDKTKKLLDEYGIELTCEIEGCELLCDSKRVTSALVHIILYAARTVKNGGSITIKTSASDRFAELEIIAASSTNTPAFNSSPEYQTEEAGSHVELLVASGIINVHGGKLGIKTHDCEQLLWVNLPLPLDEL